VMMGQRVLHAAWAYERARGVILDTFSSWQVSTTLEKMQAPSILGWAFAVGLVLHFPLLDPPLLWWVSTILCYLVVRNKEQFFFSHLVPFLDLKKGLVTCIKGNRVDFSWFFAKKWLTWISMHQIASWKDLESPP
jgi:hypothetical protein